MQRRPPPTESLRGAGRLGLINTCTIKYKWCTVKYTALAQGCPPSKVGPAASSCVSRVRWGSVVYKSSSAWLWHHFVHEGEYKSEGILDGTGVITKQISGRVGQLRRARMNKIILEHLFKFFVEVNNVVLFICFQVGVYTVTQEEDPMALFDTGCDVM